MDEVQVKAEVKKRDRSSEEAVELGPPPTRAVHKKEGREFASATLQSLVRYPKGSGLRAITAVYRRRIVIGDRPHVIACMLEHCLFVVTRFEDLRWIPGCGLSITRLKSLVLVQLARNLSSKSQGVRIRNHLRDLEIAFAPRSSCVGVASYHRIAKKNANNVNPYVR